MLGIPLVALVLGLAGCSKPASDEPTHEVHAKTSSAKKYHCPMHPTYITEKPGDCPICGMKLVLISPDDAAPAASADASTVTGRTTINLSADKRQRIGLTLGKVEERELALTVRTTAVVQHNETRYARIAPRFSGWVRKLNVNFTGATVEKGQSLFSVYSPELYGTESDYLVAWRAVQQFKDDTPAPQREGARSLLESARMRLMLWEVGEDEIEELQKRGTASQELVYRAPFAGHVLSKTAVEGKAFMAGETLYEIADLSNLWLQATVSEADLALMTVGLEATVSFPNHGNLTFSAPVTFIDPHLDPQTRRGTVRLELDNPEHRLRPEMWADVEIEIPLGRKLTVPASAVIDTGKRFVAFTVADGDRLEPRELKIGAKTNEFYEVRKGLVAGEQVVNRALFLVDSESQLQAAISGMGEAGKHEH